METTLIDFATTQIGSNGVFFGLFVVVCWHFKKEVDRGRDENKAREEKMYNQLEKSNEQLDKSISALEGLQKNFESLNAKIDHIQESIRG